MFIFKLKILFSCLSFQCSGIVHWFNYSSTVPLSITLLLTAIDSAPYKLVLDIAIYLPKPLHLASSFALHHTAKFCPIYLWTCMIINGRADHSWLNYYVSQELPKVDNITSHSKRENVSKQCIWLGHPPYQFNEKVFILKTVYHGNLHGCHSHIWQVKNGKSCWCT